MTDADHSISTVTSDLAGGNGGPDHLGTDDQGRQLPFVVAFGASAGGLDALKRVLPGLPVDLGVAYVIVQHLAPRHHTTMPAMLSSHTDLPIETIVDGIRILPDTIYLAPPGTDVTLVDDRLRLHAGADGGIKPSIDSFFRSIAECRQNHAAGVVLSGTGIDGSRGIRSIKACGGITMAQTPDSARFGGMPGAAINTGLVDRVLPPDKIGAAIASAVKHARQAGQSSACDPVEAIGTILDRVRRTTGVNYAAYKRSTIQRRIRRRMAMCKAGSLTAYLRILDTQPEELAILGKDLLIPFTGFFRDAQAFDALAGHLRRLIAQKPPGKTFRAWVPGCSTGEEAYSIAMLVAEILGERLHDDRIQIFATDIDDDSVAHTRRGVYPLTAITQSDWQRFGHFFQRDAETVTVDSAIRDRVVVARHDLLRDASFMRLDLISCRNLMIYLSPPAQARLLSLFHFSLNPEGLLFLGKSEAVRRRKALFAPVEAHWKIFRRKQGPARRFTDFIAHRRNHRPPSDRLDLSPPADSPTVHEGTFIDSMLSMLGCAAVLIDRNADIRHIRGDVSPYFRFPEGHTGDRLNVVAMARPELQLALQSMVSKGEEASPQAFSREVTFDDSRQGVEIKIGPLTRAGGDGLRVITFSSVAPPVLGPEQQAQTDPDQHGKDALAGEVRRLRRQLRDTRRQSRTDAQALQHLNETLRSTNEKLQAANEEMETGNEELHTLNDELMAKSDEAADFLRSIPDSEKRYRRLVENMNEALMVGEVEYDAFDRPTDLIVLQTNPVMQQLLGVVDPKLPQRAVRLGLGEIVTPSNLERLAWVVEKGQPRRLSVRLAAIRKDLALSVFNIGNDRLGIVCRDDTERNRITKALAASERKYRELIETANSIIIRWDRQGIIRFVNDYGLRFFGYTREELVGQNVMKLLPESSGGRDMQTLIRDIVANPEQYTYVPNENVTRDGRLVWVAWTNKANMDAHGEVREILAIGNDITALKQTEASLREKEARLSVSLDEKEILLKEIHHRVKNNMQVISSLVALQSDTQADTAMRDILKDINHRVRSMALVHEKLYQSGDLANIECADYIQSLLSYLRTAYGMKASGIRVTTTLEPITLPVNTAVPCGLIMNELVSNVFKHAFAGRDGGQVEITLNRLASGGLRLSVRDDGIGMPATVDWRQPQTLGLQLVQMLVDQLGGTLSVSVGRGTETLIRIGRYE